MSKRWTLKDDEFLFTHHEVGANFVASHDLCFKGKDAGVKRVAKLKETGIWELIAASHAARSSLVEAHTLAFGPNWAKEFVLQDRAYAELERSHLSTRGIQ